MTDTTTAGDRLVSLKTLSERWDIPAETLRYWRHVGRGPESLTIGRNVYYRESALAAYLTQCEAEDQARRDK